MRILFTADWHIKLKQKNVPKEWQINRYNLLFNKLHELEDLVDIIIIGGDIFDTVPSMEELSLFFKYISETKIQHIIFDGNHEATKKGQTFLHHLDSICSKLSNTIILKEPTSMFNIDFIPYTHIKSFSPKDFYNKILCTHVRGEIKPHVKPEIDLTKLTRWNLVLAGDLHSYSNSQRNIVYPGSPLTTSFHRSEVSNGVLLCDTESLEYEWVDLELPQLLRKTVKSTDEIVETDYHHTIYEIKGNVLELSKVDTSNKLLDKKVINKSSKSTLNMHDLSIIEELSLYLEKIVGLEKGDIQDILKVYHDYT